MRPPLGCDATIMAFEMPSGGGIHRVSSPGGAVLLEQNDEWQTQRRCMQVEAFAMIDAADVDHILSLETQAA